MSNVSEQMLALAQRCKDAEEDAAFYREWVEKVAEIATDDEVDAWDKAADDFPGYIDLFSVILSARKALEMRNGKNTLWRCPIKKQGCKANCGNYGCGN